MVNLIERFLGRFEVWRRSVPLRNPLNVPAVVIALSIAQTIYTLVTTQRITWGVSGFPRLRHCVSGVVSPAITSGLAGIAVLGTDGPHTAAFWHRPSFSSIFFGLQSPCPLRCPRL